MKRHNFFILLIFSLVAINCGGTSSSSVGGTETGTTDSGISTTNLATKFEAAASALVPQMNSSDVSSSLSEASFAITYGSSSDWSTYLTDSNDYLITDVFGSEEESPQVVTKIRVLLDQFQSDLSTLFTNDSELDCTGANLLNEEDTLTVAFYGNLSNGTSSNRFYDCLVENSSETTVYGTDSDNTVRVVTMSENTSENTEQTSTRGTSSTLYQVIHATYAEATESGSTVSYLDLQYAQSTVYVGADETAGTSDDVVFKSRSRITGRAVLDSDGNPTQATGDFTVTKYDKGVNEDTSTFTITTQTIGRGSYDDADVSLFSIDSDASTVSDLAGTFCLEHSDTTLPSDTDGTNCEDLETTYAWGSSEFPFTLTPSIEEDYELKEFFAGDDTDLIDEEGSNFTIPAYTSTENTSDSES